MVCEPVNCQERVVRDWLASKNPVAGEKLVAKELSSVILQIVKFPWA